MSVTAGAYAARLVKRSGPGPDAQAFGGPARAPDLFAEMRASVDRMMMEARDEAGAIVEAAREEARQLLAQAETKRAAVGAEVAQLHAEAEASRDESVGTLARILDFRRNFACDMRELRIALARLTREATEKIIRDTHGEQAYCRAIETALDRYADSSNVVLHVARADQAHIREMLAQYDGSERSIQLFVDIALKPGMCRIATGGETVDIGIELQLDLLEQVLSGEYDAA